MAGERVPVDDLPSNVVPASDLPTAGGPVKPSKTPGEMALEGMSGPQKFLVGIGKGMTDVGRAVGQFVGAVDRQDVTDAQQRDAALMDTGAGLAGSIVGNLALTALPGAGAAGVATRAAGAVLPAVLAPTAGAAASGALVSGLTTPVGNEDSRLTNAAIGAAGGAIGDVATRTAARVAQPITQSPAVQTLLQNGIVPTPGQAAGANSFIGRMEQRLQSIPIIGDIITGARNRSVAEMNSAAINRAVPPGAGRVAGIGRAAIEHADDVLSQGYDDVLSRIPTVRPTPGFISSVQSSLTDPDLALTAASQSRLRNILRMQFGGRPGVDQQTGEMSGELAKSIDSTLGRLAREYQGSSIAEDRSLGMALRNVQGQWRGAIRAAAPDAQTAAELDALNRAYANFVRVERAASYTGAREGVFTPDQLQRAVRASDTSTRKGAFAQGRALMQDLSDPASATLSNTVSNSGTPERLMLAMALGGGAGAANEYFGGPSYLTGLALAPLAYSRTGSRYLVGDLAGQGALAELVRRMAPAATQVGRATATQK